MWALLRRQGTTEMLIAMGFVELQTSTGLCTFTCNIGLFPSHTRWSHGVVYLKTTESVPENL